MNANQRDSASPRRPAGRPTRKEAARIDVAIRDAALDTFLTYGYSGTSMEAIAAAAGVTKSAVYARYPSKAAVFGAVLKWAADSEDWPVAAPVVPEAAGLESALRATARTALRHDLHPDAIRLYRVVAAQAEQFPDLLGKHSVQPTWPLRRRVIELLQEHARAGDIEVPGDPQTWAVLFLGLVSDVPARLAAVGVRPSPAKLEQHMEASLQIFMRSLRRC